MKTLRSLKKVYVTVDGVTLPPNTVAYLHLTRNATFKDARNVTLYVGTSGTRVFVCGNVVGLTAEELVEEVNRSLVARGKPTLTLFSNSVERK
jgi:hypothetical protein